MLPEFVAVIRCRTSLKQDIVGEELLLESFTAVYQSYLCRPLPELRSPPVGNPSPVGDDPSSLKIVVRTEEGELELGEVDWSNHLAWSCPSNLTAALQALLSACRDQGPQPA